jgi:hypothetical protein
MALSIRRGAFSMGERSIQFYAQGTSVDTVGDGRLLSAGLLPVAVSILTTFVWFAYRRWRQRRRPASTVASP